MKLAIFGGTGKSGRALIQQALDQGHEIVALARNPAAVPIQSPKLRWITGSVLNPEDVRETIRGQDAVLSALGARELRKVAIYSQSTRVILAAMRELGVKRFVTLTSAGVEDVDPSYGLIYRVFLKGLLLRSVYADMIRMEAELKSVDDVDWIIVRPTLLTDGPKTARYRVSPRFCPPGKDPKISREDVAHFMLERLRSVEHVFGTPTLAY